LSGSRPSSARTVFEGGTAAAESKVDIVGVMIDVDAGYRLRGDTLCPGAGGRFRLCSALALFR
jgi:hypothetical protein